MEKKANAHSWLLVTFYCLSPCGGIWQETNVASPASSGDNFALLCILSLKGGDKTPHVIIIDLGLIVNKLPVWQMQHYLATLLNDTHTVFSTYMYPYVMMFLIKGFFATRQAI